MPLENRADHEFAAYDDPQECGLHLAASHQVGVQHPYEIDQHWSLHFHRTDSAADADPAHEHEHEHGQEWADAGELRSDDALTLGIALRQTGWRLVRDEDRPAETRACPHCGGPVYLMVSINYVARVREQQQAVTTALLAYFDATAELLAHAHPLDPATLT